MNKFTFTAETMDTRIENFAKLITSALKKNGKLSFWQMFTYENLHFSALSIIFVRFGSRKNTTESEQKICQKNKTFPTIRNIYLFPAR